MKNTAAFAIADHHGDIVGFEVSYDAAVLKCGGWGCLRAHDYTVVAGEWSPTEVHTHDDIAKAGVADTGTDKKPYR